MAIRQTYSLFCDGCGPKCHGWIGEFEKQDETAQRLRFYASTRYWKRVKVSGKMKDYCPACFEDLRRCEK